MYFDVASIIVIILLSLAFIFLSYCLIHDKNKDVIIPIGLLFCAVLLIVIIISSFTSFNYIVQGDVCQKSQWYQSGDIKIEDEWYTIESRSAFRSIEIGDTVTLDVVERPKLGGSYKSAEVKLQTDRTTGCGTCTCNCDGGGYGYNVS